MFFSLFTKKENLYIPNQRAHNYIGCTVLVVEEIKNGKGKIKTDDNSLWDAEGADCPVGTLVKITELLDDHCTFHVEIIT